MSKCPVCGYQETDRKQRSNGQNRYFFGVVVPIVAQYTGYTAQETADMLKTMFLTDRMHIMTVNGIVEAAKTRGTSGLSTVEWEKFMSDIRSWASRELRLFIPEPNESMEIYENTRQI